METIIDKYISKRKGHRAGILLIEDYQQLKRQYEEQLVIISNYQRLVTQLLNKTK